MSIKRAKYLFMQMKTDNEHEKTNIQLRCDAGNLDELLPEMRNFLRACGFAIDGDLIVKDVDDDDSGNA